jgi:hypothetical protein
LRRARILAADGKGIVILALTQERHRIHETRYAATKSHTLHNVT